MTVPSSLKWLIWFKRTRVKSSQVQCLKPVLGRSKIVIGGYKICTSLIEKSIVCACRAIKLITWIFIEAEFFITDIKKQTQELYALINFGELRKKISLSNKKHYEKLSEMIYSGSTQLKFRGKVRKVRTPLCKALRKLNQIEGKLLYSSTL